MVAEGDLVGVWATYEGTQQGPIGPLPASDGKTRFDFGAMFRMADSKIAEWWVTWDNMTICGNSAICRVFETGATRGARSAPPPTNARDPYCYQGGCAHSSPRTDPSIVGTPQ